MNKVSLLIFLLSFGTFGILTTEMGFVGILPLLADHFNVSVVDAGIFVSIFALGVAIAGLIMPLIFSKINYKKSLLLVLAVFIVSNILFIFVDDFNLAILLRVIPAFFHPIFCSFALTVASDISGEGNELKAASRVIMGVSAGMILGVPIVSFLAFNWSFEVAMMFMAVVNIISFISLAIVMPSLEPKEGISYSGQLKVLKKPVFLLSIVGVILLTAGLYSVYSYSSVFLGLSNIVGNLLSVVLFIFGIFSMFGNYIAANLLTKFPIKAVLAFPFILSAIFLLLFGFYNIDIVVMGLAVFWGILAGIGNNIQQFWIVSSAPEAPEFANGVFLSSGNIGVTLGTSLSAFVISAIGARYILFVGIGYLVLAFIFFVLRNKFNNSHIGVN